MSLLGKQKEMTYEDAVLIYKMARAFKRDWPDGMEGDLREAATAYRESDKSEGAKADFAADVDSICKDWGFSL